MLKKAVQRISAPLLLASLLLLALFWSFRPNAKAGGGLQRPEDPVVVSGAALPDLQGQPLAELVLYAYDGANWDPVPFQIDERNITGTYVISEDGLLDDNDELVFMAKDTAQFAADQWPDDTAAQANPRYVLEVNDPLNPGDMAWAYLYHSPTLPRSGASYVDWDEGLQTVTAVSYTAGFDPQNFVGLADLTVNGSGVDILDRQKTRVTAFIITLNEEDLADQITATVDIPVLGPIRGVANGDAFNVSIYGARLEFNVTFDTSGLPVSVDEMRTSLDLNDPGLTGITSYYDSNGTAVTIDGSPDAVPASPVLDWYQAGGGPGGFVVVFQSVDAGGGSVSNYYKDDDTPDSGDTGDQLSYADAGLIVTDPGTLIQFSLAIYILPPGSSSNVGQGYYDRAASPLQATASSETVNDDSFIFLPLVADLPE